MQASIKPCHRGVASSRAARREHTRPPIHARVVHLGALPTSVEVTPTEEAVLPVAAPSTATPAPPVSTITEPSSPNSAISDVPTAAAQVVDVVEPPAGLTIDSGVDSVPSLAPDAILPPTPPAGLAVDSSAVPVESASKAQDAAAASFDNQLEGVQGSAADVLDGAKSSFEQASSSFVESASDVGSSIAATTQDISSNIAAATQDVSSSLSSSLGAAAAAVGEATGDAGSALGDAFEAASRSAAESSAQLAAAASDAQVQVLQAVPPEARGAVERVLDVLGGAVSAAASHPLEVLVGGGVVGIPLAISSYFARYGGYAGDLEPQEVLNMLADQEALLVDVRTDDERAAAGVPELKFAARFRVVALPTAVAAARLRNASPMVRSQKELALEFTAVFIRGLKQLRSPLTKVVVLSSRGGQEARDVARALRKAGQYSSYIVNGGFQRWQEQGLPVTADYDTSPVGVLGDNVQVVAGQLSKLRDPSVAVPVAGLAVVSGVAVANYHLTLEYIGILGSFFLLYRFISRYESPQQVLDELTGLLPKPAPRSASQQPRMALATASSGSTSSSSESLDMGISSMTSSSFVDSNSTTDAPSSTASNGSAAPTAAPTPSMALDNSGNDISAVTAAALVEAAAEAEAVEDSSRSANSGGSSSSNEDGGNSDAAAAPAEEAAHAAPTERHAAPGQSSETPVKPAVATLLGDVDASDALAAAESQRQQQRKDAEQFVQRATADANTAEAPEQAKEAEHVNAM